MKTAVVILNWNGRKFLEQFLPNVIENSPEAEVIVADNASTDDSVEFLKQNFPQLRIIINNSNGGFSKGYNDALAQIDAEYFVLLNSDIEVTPNWISPIIQMMDNDPQIAVCQPKILSYFERHKFEYAGAAGGFIDRFGYPFCRGRLFQDLEDDHGQYDDVCEVFWATGAAMFVRADVYKQLGGLDEDFFAHMEEIDFCWRAKNANYKIMYCPQSSVYHIGGGTLPKSSSRKTYLNFRNNLSLLYKNLPTKDMLPVFTFRVLFDVVASLSFLTHSLDEFRAVFRAYRHFIRMFPKNRDKRHSAPKQHPVSRIYSPSIVWDYYVFGKKKFSELRQADFQ